MKKFKVLLFIVCISFFGITSASGAVIHLAEYAFNIDGVVSNITIGDPLPTGVDITTGFGATGLGTITIDITGAGAHSVIGFFDHEIVEETNTFFNEYGATMNLADDGQSWEIDEPGWDFGDIYNNFLDSALEGANGVPMGSEDDVSMAMGWDFNLAVGETGSVSFVLSEIAPPLDFLGFYLTQTDPDSEDSIYFSSNLSIGGQGEPIPEPTTMLLVGTGLAGLFGVGRKRFKR